jgi:putative two-component system response regulator
MLMKTFGILIVDDEKRILDTFSLMLAEMGYYVETASHPDEALSLIGRRGFDIVFIDYFLGATIGLDLLARMSLIDPSLHFVVITANGSADLAVESLKKGASDFIVKPFFTADLRRSIEYVRKKIEIDTQKKELLSTLELKLTEKENELRRVNLSVLSSLAQAMEKKDIGTYGHSMRVSRYSLLIAAALGLGHDERNDLKAASLLHDIGKIGISDFILGKKGPLDESETDAVRSHPQNGVEILRPLKQFEPILPAILHHHENFDGSGYPHGLIGEEIPLHARIIAVADTYDAILSDRPYRAASDHDRAVRELFRNCGSQFDKKIVDAFVVSCEKCDGLLADYETAGNLTIK